MQSNSRRPEEKERQEELVQHSGSEETARMKIGDRKMKRCTPFKAKEE
jgi:hypothetical protein